MIGRIVSTELKNTATVLVEGQKIHPLYKKAFIQSKKYLVDDPIRAGMGDMVEIVKVAPISKRKHFRIVKVLGKRLEEITAEKLKEQAKGIIEEIMPAEKEPASANSEKKVVMDNSAEKSKSKKKGGTELSKK